MHTHTHTHTRTRTHTHTYTHTHTHSHTQAKSGGGRSYQDLGAFDDLDDEKEEGLRGKAVPVLVFYLFLTCKSKPVMTETKRGVDVSLCRYWCRTFSTFSFLLVSVSLHDLTWGAMVWNERNCNCTSGQRYCSCIKLAKFVYIRRI